MWVISIVTTIVESTAVLYFVEVVAVGLCNAGGVPSALTKAPAQPPKGSPHAAHILFPAGKVGRGQGGEFVAAHVGDGAESDRADGDRVADKQLPAPQHATTVKTQKSIGQAQCREGRNRSPDNAPQELTTLLGIADHRIQPLRPRNPVLHFLTEPGPCRRSGFPAELSPGDSPSDGRGDRYGNHSN
jgi:hypothetical protein